MFYFLSFVVLPSVNSNYLLKHQITIFRIHLLKHFIAGVPSSSKIIEVSLNDGENWDSEGTENFTIIYSYRLFLLIKRVLQQWDCCQWVSLLIYHQQKLLSSKICFFVLVAPQTLYSTCCYGLLWELRTVMIFWVGLIWMRPTYLQIIRISCS